MSAMGFMSFIPEAGAPPEKPKPRLERKDSRKAGLEMGLVKRKVSRGKKPSQSPPDQSPRELRDEFFVDLVSSVHAAEVGGMVSTEFCIDSLKKLWTEMMRQRDCAASREQGLLSAEKKVVEALIEEKERVERLNRLLEKDRKKREKEKRKRKDSTLALTMSDVVPLRSIAVGGSGSTVLEARMGGFTCVVKEYTTAQMTSQEELANVMHEVQMLDALPDHPNLLGCLHTELLEDSIRIIMPKMDCNLHDLRTSSPELFTRDTVRQVALGVASGLECLHQHDILHRDVKAGNVMVTVDVPSRTVLEVALGDFDCAVVLAEDQKMECIGTPGFMAPEVLNSADGGEPYGFPADVFAFGMLVFELIFGRAPYSECKQAFRVSEAILTGVPPQAEKSLCAVYRDMFLVHQACTRMKAAERPTMEAVRYVLEKLCAGEMDEGELGRALKGPSSSSLLRSRSKTLA